LKAVEKKLSKLIEVRGDKRPARVRRTLI